MLKRLFVILLLNLSLTSFGFAQVAADTTYRSVIDTADVGDFPGYDEAPKYPGGLPGLVQFISNNIRWPKKTDDIEGKVIVRFIVNKSGTLSGFKLIERLRPDLDTEAIRVLKSSRVWLPAKRNGRPVPIMFTLPIHFAQEK